MSRGDKLCKEQAVDKQGKKETDNFFFFFYNHTNKQKVGHKSKGKKDWHITHQQFFNKKMTFSVKSKSKK